MLIKMKGVKKNVEEPNLERYFY